MVLYYGCVKAGQIVMRKYEITMCFLSLRLSTEYQELPLIVQTEIMLFWACIILLYFNKCPKCIGFHHKKQFVTTGQ